MTVGFVLFAICQIEIYPPCFEFIFLVDYNARSFLGSTELID